MKIIIICLKKRIKHNLFLKIKLKLFILFFLFLSYFFEYFFFGENNREIIININSLFHIQRKLTNFIDDVTIVSAYFKIISKHSFSEYSEWISNFLQINRSMVFFIDSLYYQEIISKRPKEYRDKTIWIKTTLTDFYSYKNYFNEFNQTYNIDLEKSIHSVPLYLIWAEKVNFVKIAILKNFYKSKCFYWFDAGCFRDRNNIKNYINGWPSEEKCFEDGRVLFNEVINYSNFFKDKIISFDIEAHNFWRKYCNVDGSSFGGQTDYLLKFNSLYYKTLNSFLKHGIFIGNDQNIFAFIAYSNKNIVKLVYLRNFFGLQDYLKK